VPAAARDSQHGERRVRVERTIVIPDSTYARRSYITQPVPRIVAAPLLLTRERFGARQDLSSIEAPAGLFVEIGACWFSGA
jgi:hypothetical protein